MRIIDGQPVDELELGFTAPFDWVRMLRFFGGRATGGVETVSGDVYHRTIGTPNAPGLLRVRKDPSRNVLIVSIEGEVSRETASLVPKLKRLFDVDTQIDLVRADLSQDPWIATLLDAAPGLRVPGVWSAFELVVRTIIGQQVSVKAATTVLSRVVERAGARTNRPRHATIPWHFPSPASLATADLDRIGMPTKRIAALQNFARAVAKGELVIEAEHPDVEALKRQLLELPGIGPWTVEYTAMRAWRDPDAWPGTDLVLMQAILRRFPELGKHSDQLKHSQAWRPWRAHVAMHLWNEIADQAGVAKGG